MSALAGETSLGNLSDTCLVDHAGKETIMSRMTRASQTKLGLRPTGAWGSCRRGRPSGKDPAGNPVHP
jgi:hypothetical protein